MALGASSWIKLNVGGQPFLTTMETILSCPDSVLSKMFDPESGFEPAHKENGVYFIDADPKYFGIILNWMRYRQIITGSEINLNAVAKIADYYGLVDLVEEIKKSQNPSLPIIGKWFKYDDLPCEKEVAAMRMTLVHPSDGPEIRIVQTMCSRGITIDLDVEEEKHLSLELEGRSAVWVQTTTGRIPPEAIAVEGEGGKRMFIGRRLWVEDGTALKVFNKKLNGDMTIPEHAYISVGYVNEKGIWSIDFSKSVKDIVDHSTRERNMWEEMIDSFDVLHCISSEFEILCIF